MVVEKYPLLILGRPFSGEFSRKHLTPRWSITTLGASNTLMRRRAKLKASGFGVGRHSDLGLEKEAPVLIIGRVNPKQGCWRGEHGGRMINQFPLLSKGRFGEFQLGLLSMPVGEERHYVWHCGYCFKSCLGFEEGCGDFLLHRRLER